MKKISTNLSRYLTAFLQEHYLVLFFMLTTFIKLLIIGTFVIDLRWSECYLFSILCSLFSSELIFSSILFAKKHKNLIAIILSLVISIILFIDVVYFSDRTTLPSVGLIGLIGRETDGVTGAILDLIQWQYFLIFVDLGIALVFKKRIRSFLEKIKDNQKISKLNMYFLNVFFISLVIFLLFFSMALSGKDTLRNVYEKSYDSVSTTQYYGILITHAIDTVRYIDQETSSLSVKEQQEIINWVNEYKSDQGTSSRYGNAKDKNIILIQVESLGSFVINRKINNQEITPNLNELANSTYYFPNNRYIIGAGHSSDTDFVVNNSYFPLESAATLVRYGQYDFSSLPKLLEIEGYGTSAYHGFVKGFWNRDIAYNSFGYDKFFSSADYSDGAQINLGLNDGVFLNETADYIQIQSIPSFSSIITLTSHTPFEITELTQGLGLNPDDFPNQVAGYLENIHYVDKSLGNFFAELKDYGLYEDSLIIIYGDHTPALHKFDSDGINFDPSTNQSSETPIIIKLPNQTSGSTYNDIGTNLDIMPTVLDLVGIKTDQLMFGQSLFYQIENNIPHCPDQIIIFEGLGDCENSRLEQENISSKIIRYNQFQNLPVN